MEVVLLKNFIRTVDYRIGSCAVDLALLYKYKPFESSQDAVEVMKNAFESLSKIGGNSEFFVEDPFSDPVYDHIKPKVEIDVNSFDEIFGKNMNFKACIARPNLPDNDKTYIDLPGSS